MSGKNILITGATSGIGEETALALADLGANVTIAGRDEERCMNTLVKILDRSPEARLDFLVADLSEISQVRNLAIEYQNRNNQLNVLVNNAGAVYIRRRVSTDGYEMTFATNHLNYFTLTNLLLPLLEETAEQYGESRIVNVSSNAHRGVKIDFDDLQSVSNYQPMRAYSKSKLANILFSFELARRIQASNVSVNALHPGFISTNLGTNHNPFLKFLYRLFIHPFAKSREEGARTSVYLASNPDVKGISGKYYADCKQTSADLAAYDSNTAERLWQVSADMVIKVDPTIRIQS